MSGPKEMDPSSYEKALDELLRRLNQSGDLVADGGSVGYVIPCDSCGGSGLNRNPLEISVHCELCSGRGELFDEIIEVQRAIQRALNPPQPAPDPAPRRLIRGLDNWATITWAQQVVWCFAPAHPVAIKPGSFREALLAAIRAADPGNRRQIGHSYEDAYRMYRLADEDFDWFVACVETATESMGRK